ncbi:permease for cytosine/purines, uracil, thiamine, allantoin-domain-containing protein [Lipomyces japonicus]|uniref:permease for cytosine/purines, uracil, thiamine, allantoin-domain-containing protein n=1 Tax=Lipomyces japonicus TaxID=56871 RepID=UPI0034CDC5DF
MNNKISHNFAVSSDPVIGESADGSSSGGYFSRIKKFCELDSVSNGRYSNKDLDPVPLAERTWIHRHYAVFWISDNLSVSGFRNAASVMEIGLSWRLALVNVTLANIIWGGFVYINGIAGAKYHIPFSVHTRAAFGYYLAYLMIAMRMIVGIFWYGIQTYTGAECVQSILYALWPSFRNVPNTLPESANINTQFMTSYVIYFITCLPFHYVGVHRIRWLYLTKTITLPICSLAIMGWMIKQVGIGETSLFKQGNTRQGSALGWAFMSGLYSNIGSGVTLICNANDYSRYARRPRDTFATALSVPITACFVTFIGVVYAAGSNVLYGSILWDPLLIINHWTSRGGRAAAFFCAFSFYLSQLGLNIAANSLAAANDLNCLFPRYINLRRGQFVAAFLGGWALTPWNILTSAPAFLNFMSGYSVWLGPLAGILVSDFYIVHKQKYNVYELYKFTGIYRYWHGINWRAFLAFTIGWVPLLPGFIPTVSSNSTSTGMVHLYNLGFFYGFGAAFFSYAIICHFWPAQATMLAEAIFVDDEGIDAVGVLEAIEEANLGSSSSVEVEKN